MVILLWAYNAQYSSVEGLDLKPLTTFSDVANLKQVMVGSWVIQVGRKHRDTACGGKSLSLTLFNFPLSFLSRALWSLPDGGRTLPFEGKVQSPHMDVISSYLRNLVDDTS